MSLQTLKKLGCKGEAGQRRKAAVKAVNRVNQNEPDHEGNWDVAEKEHPGIFRPRAPNQRRQKRKKKKPREFNGGGHAEAHA